MEQNVVIVGNGITAITAIKAIREEHKDWPIYVFGNEKIYPYNRIRLSKGLVEKLDEDKILLQNKTWYDENNVNMYIDKEVVSIDTTNKEIKISDGSILNYSKLLLANGASEKTPNIKGVQKQGVFTLRTLEDANNIIENTKKYNNILNIGGGIQGLEIAWMLYQLGKKVTIVEILERLMPKQLDNRASQILEEAIKHHNIGILLNTNVIEILGDSHANGYITDKDEKYDCDVVIHSIGIEPNTEILENTNIKTNYGILVNNKMETNIKDVYAAGDIAELDNHIYGLWNIAIGQGKVAGQNICGKDIIYEHIVPVTTLNAFGIQLFSMGQINENNANSIILEDEPATKSYKKILVRDNKIIGAIVIGDIKYSPAIKTAIEKEVNISNIDLSNITFDEFVENLKLKNK